jgi:hypothetical protein
MDQPHHHARKKLGCQVHGTIHLDKTHPKNDEHPEDGNMGIYLIGPFMTKHVVVGTMIMVHDNQQKRAIITSTATVQTT